MKRFYAKLICGAVLLQTAAFASGISCLGVPVQGAPIYRAGGNIVTAIRNFLASVGITV